MPALQLGEELADRSSNSAKPKGLTEMLAENSTAGVIIVLIFIVGMFGAGGWFFFTRTIEGTWLRQVPDSLRFAREQRERENRQRKS